LVLGISIDGYIARLDGTEAIRQHKGKDVWLMGGGEMP